MSISSPTCRVLEEKEISRHPSYHGWPTITRRRDGELLVVSSAGRMWHVCPFGQIHLIRSRDNGATWSEPEILADGPLDDRDAGILETPTGALLVNWFSSAAWTNMIDTIFSREEFREKKDLQAEFRRKSDAVTPQVLRDELGAWMMRSEDGGRTWSPKYRTCVNSPHGPVMLRDGRLLYAGKITPPTDGRTTEPFADIVGVAQSRDDGRTWEWLAEIPVMEGHQPSEYHELHAVQATDGTIIVHIRCESKTLYIDEVLQTESRDGGRTWTIPHSIGSWGIPSFLMPRKNGSILFTYSYRKFPCGNRARLSVDNGCSWSDEIIISDSGGIHADLGYPSMVELDDGSFLSVWYQWNPEKGYATLRQSHWCLEMQHLPSPIATDKQSCSRKTLSTEHT